ncbi:MAG: CaiB/BaiF CoA transferase family protein [Cellvibrionales bacterium]|nr:CoA transferase [Porticoccaceae bacterium]
MNLPLQGIRVLAIEQFGAGPYGSMYLADFGAEVIKIESRESGGDPARQTGATVLAEDDSAYFQALNLNKKSVTLNLKSDEGKALFHELVKTADVVWNNLRGNQPARLGLDYANLKAIKEDIVCTHISAYGRDNNRADWPGYDYLMQSECGFLELTGEPESPPTRFGLSIIDFMTGTVAAMGCLAALIGRAKYGGRDVDVSLFDVALHQLTYPGTWYMNHGIRTERLPRGSHPSQTPVQLLKTADSWIFVMCMTDKFWYLLIDIIEHPQLAQDARFATMRDRAKNRDALTPILDEILQRDVTANWLAKLQTHIPVSPVYDLPAALDNPFVEHVQMRAKLAHRGDELRVLRNPIRFDQERLATAPGPGLGAHNEQLLGQELGLADQLEDFKRRGII